jgi:hypothetical protein
MMQDAKQTPEKEIVTSLDACVAERERTSECVLMEKATDPGWDFPKVLLRQQFARQFPSGR